MFIPLENLFRRTFLQTNANYDKDEQVINLARAWPDGLTSPKSYIASSFLGLIILLFLQYNNVGSR